MDGYVVVIPKDDTSETQYLALKHKVGFTGEPLCQDTVIVRDKETAAAMLSTAIITSTMHSDESTMRALEEAQIKFVRNFHRPYFE